MSAAPAIIAGLTAVTGAFLQYQAGKRQEAAGKEAEKMAKKNAERERAETEEAARRLEKEQGRTMALARARAAASGVSGVGSTGLFLSELESENRAELDWLLEAGKTRAEDILQQGRYARKGAASSAWQSYGGGLQSLLGGASYIADWYNKP